MNTPSTALAHSHPRLRHVAAVLAALSLLVVSTAVWAEPGRDALATLPSTSAEVPTGPTQWRTDREQARAAVEVTSRQPAVRADAAPWNDTSSVQVRYVHWAPTAGNRAAVGLSMGMGAVQNGLARSPVGYVDPRTAGTTLVPEVGVRLRTNWLGDRRVDVGAWSAYDASANTPASERRSYNARVELQFRENKSKLGFDMRSGAFGMQLSSTSQLQLRTKHGGPMVYYRSKW
ncbi:hypothetical protein [Ideonella sp. BN130291]|uniref:hypothetical protein n=1 Tax=Ideonella sp. BN130291 TaxID=3112940 RepID=UPI002E2717BF|nr:hypothetical protein [Ideonella sp. BN130291]